MSQDSTEVALGVVRRWAEQLGCTAPEAYEYRLATMADELTSMLRGARDGALTHETLVQACKNIGFDLTCGACAALFFTGYTGPTARYDAIYEHDPNCKTERR